MDTIASLNDIHTLYSQIKTNTQKILLYKERKCLINANTKPLRHRDKSLFEHTTGSEGI